MSGVAPADPANNISPETPGERPALIRGVVFVATRVPFTCAVVAAMIVLAVATGTLWGALQDKSWFPDVGYGLPSFEDGRWWTIATGPFFAVTPWQYLPVIGGFALFVGLAELRLGTWRTMAVTIAGQWIAVLAAAGFLAVARNWDWDWAERLSLDIDAGFSAGAMAALVVAAATLPAPWRLRVRVAVLLYVVIAALYLGALWDLEHLIAVLVFLPASHWIAGTTQNNRPATRREWRLIACVMLALIALVPIVALLTPSDGPLGDTADLDEDSVSVLITLIIVLLLINGLRKGGRVAWRWAVGIALVYVALSVLVLVLILISTIIDEDIVLEGFPFFLASGIQWLILLLVLTLGRRAFRVPSKRLRRKAERSQDFDRDDAIALTQKYGGGSISWMTTWPENRYFVGSGDQTFVAYRKHAGVAVGLGDPVGLAEQRPGTVLEFAEMCDNSGLVPCLFSATQVAADASESLGWRALQVAEDTVIDLDGLAFKGKAWQDVRTALNRAKKEGVEFRMVTLADEPRAVIAQVRAISEEWVGDKGLPEMGFTLGGVDEALDPRVRVGLALDGEGVIQGVTSWMPVYDEGGAVRGWTLDVMRRRNEGFRPVVEFLIASSCLAFQEDGASFLSLSGAPLARADGDEAVGVLDIVLERLGAMLEPYYGFRSLHSFKAKFQPRYEPMYLVYRDEADLPRIGLAIARAYLPQADVRDMIKLMRAPA